MSFLGKTPLSFFSRNSRSSASYTPANDPVQRDADPEPEPDSKSMAQRMLDERAAEPSVASALSKVLPWKSAGSAEEQADAVRGKLSYNVRKDRILLLCMAIEDEKATLVQRRWRLKMAKRDHYLNNEVRENQRKLCSCHLNCLSVCVGVSIWKSKATHSLSPHYEFRGPYYECNVCRLCSSPGVDVGRHACSHRDRVTSNKATFTEK